MVCQYAQNGGVDVQKLPVRTKVTKEETLAASIPASVQSIVATNQLNQTDTNPQPSNFKPLPSAHCPFHLPNIPHSLERKTDAHKDIEAMWKSLGKTGLFATTSFQKRMKMQTEMGNPDVKLTLEALVGSLLTLTTELDLLPEDPNFESLKNRTRAVASLIDLFLSKIYQTPSYVIPDSTLC